MDLYEYSQICTKNEYIRQKCTNRKKTKTNALINKILSTAHFREINCFKPV